MLNKEIYLKKIAGSLALLSTQVGIRNAINLYDINIVSEDFYSGLINLIFKWDMKNANIIDNNAVAIDLYDEKNKITVQVTSDNTSTKIKHTIKEFIDKGVYKNFNRLIVLILTEKKKYTATFDTDNKFSFNKNNDIMDVKDLIKYIRGLDTKIIKEINDYLSVELDRKVYAPQESQATEVETIMALVEYISSNKIVEQPIYGVIDPDYKIYRRFRGFSKKIVSDYKNMMIIYGEALNAVEQVLENDQAKDITTMIYLQDLSIDFLDKSQNDPVEALNGLVKFFEEKISKNGKVYDRTAIKFYLTNEIIKCRVFPNERGEYYDNK